MTTSSRGLHKMAPKQLVLSQAKAYLVIQAAYEAAFENNPLPHTLIIPETQRAARKCFNPKRWAQSTKFFTSGSRDTFDTKKSHVKHSNETVESFLKDAIGLAHSYEGKRRTKDGTAFYDLHSMIFDTIHIEIMEALSKLPAQAATHMIAVELFISLCNQRYKTTSGRFNRYMEQMRVRVNRARVELQNMAPSKLTVLEETESNLRSLIQGTISEFFPLFFQGGSLGVTPLTYTPIDNDKSSYPESVYGIIHWHLLCYFLPRTAPNPRMQKSRKYYPELVEFTLKSLDDSPTSLTEVYKRAPANKHKPHQPELEDARKEKTGHVIYFLVILIQHYRYFQGLIQEIKSGSPSPTTSPPQATIYHPLDTIKKITELRTTILALITGFRAEKREIAGLDTQSFTSSENTKADSCTRFRKTSQHDQNDEIHHALTALQKFFPPPDEKSPFRTHAATWCEGAQKAKKDPPAASSFQGTIPRAAG